MRFILHLLTHTWFFGALPIMFFGIGKGPSSQEKDIYKLLSGLGSYGATKGTGATNQALDYFEAFLSGDPTKIASALAPETKIIQGQAEQRKKQMAEFGTRSGGTAAQAANIDTNTLAQIQDLVNRSRTAAAGEVAGIGQNLLGLGTNAGGSAFSAARVMQGQNAAKWDDIFKSIAEIVTGGMQVASAAGAGSAPSATFH